MDNLTLKQESKNIAKQFTEQLREVNNNPDLLDNLLLFHENVQKALRSVNFEENEVHELTKIIVKRLHLQGNIEQLTALSEDFTNREIINELVRRVKYIYDNLKQQGVQRKHLSERTADIIAMTNIG